MGIQRCGRCKRNVYCDRKCQTADWKAGHKFHCRLPEVATAEHEEDVREALASVDAEEAIIKDETVIYTDADNVGKQIRSTKLRRHDAEIKELPAEAEDEIEAAEKSTALPATSSAKAAARKKELHVESDDEFDRAQNEEDAAKSFAAADSVEPCESFSLDPDF